MSELKNIRRERFCLLIIKGTSSNAEAYIQAGFTAKNNATARACAARMLTDANVVARLNELKKKEEVVEAKILGQYQITTDRIIRQLACTAFADPRSYVSKGRRGHEVFKPISELTEEQAAAIKLVRMPDGSMRTELRDPKPALALLGQHMGLFSGEVATASNNTIVNNDNRTVVYVDHPPHETAEQWEARQRRRLGIDEPVRQRPVDATNGSAKRGH